MNIDLNVGKMCATCAVAYCTNDGPNKPVVQKRCFHPAAGVRGCLKFSAAAKASKFHFRQGKICSHSRVPMAKILTPSEVKFAACSPVTEI
jgi:expansin (peptidoglycan-binding protein)